MGRLGIMGSVAACALVLGGCQKEATGQVAAVVNDEEITLQEVNAELGEAQVPEGAAKERVQQAALQRIIDRRLLAQAARDEGVDKTPEFLLRSRQLDEALLVQLLSQRAGRSASVPDVAAIDRFMKENPAVFTGRTIYQVDRIQFQAPADPTRLRALENDHSMDAVAARLRQLGIQFTRGSAQMDSAQLGEQRVKQIRALPAGEPFILAEGGAVTVSVITGAAARPLDGEQAHPLAVRMMRSKSLSDTLRQRLEQEKAKAEISYQQGFAPPAAGAKPADAR